MTTISFDYEVWDKQDVQLYRPGSPLGFTTIHNSIDIGRATTVRQGAADSTIGPSLDGVVGVLAGSLEYLREYGLSASDVQSRVLSFMANNRSSAVQIEALSLRQANVFDVSDPGNLASRRDQTKQLG